MRENYISLTHREDEKVRIGMHIDGKLVVWIDYDAEQMDELLRQLEMFRNEMKP